MPAVWADTEARPEAQAGRIVKDTRLTPTPCPQCGHKLDAAASPVNATPREGDFTICMCCQDVLRFYLDASGELRVRKPSEADLLELPLVDVSRYQRILTQVKNRAKRRNQARTRRKRKRKTRSR